MRVSLLRPSSLMLLVSTLIASCTQTPDLPPVLRSTKSGSANALSVDQIGNFYFTQNEVRNLSAFRVPETGVIVSLWEEQPNTNQWIPFYAVSLNGRDIAVAKQTSYDLLLRYAQFDPLSQQPFGPSAQAEPLTDVRILQLNTQVLPGYREQLEAAGARVYRFLANNALIVKAPPYVASQISALPNVRWMGAYRPEYRLEEQLLAQLAISDRLEPARYRIEVFERGLYQQDIVKERIARIGGRVELVLPAGFFLEATLNGQQLAEVVQWDEVAFIDRWRPPEMDDIQVRTIGGADYLENLTGFTGQGVRAEVLDLGVLATHQEFQGTLIPHGQQSVAGHGTSTTGINFAKGIDPRARGLVPDAQGITASMTYLTDRYQHTAELVQDPYFAVYQSNSWGGGLTTQYTTVSAEMDDIIFLDDFLVTQSQSNAGSQQSRPQAWAKNIVSVGGLQHRGSLDMDTHCWCHTGSIGPAADGRIKPDLAHFYDGVFAPTTGGPASYDTGFGGTSAATPIVAGHFGLFFQMWHNGIFGNPTAATVFDSRPHATTAKAFLVNTARQWSFNGTSDDRTRTHQGWGMPDLQNLYDSRNQIFFVDETDVLQAFQSTSYQLEVLEGAPALKATMVYKDPMGTTSSTLHRINDLDLQVTSPSGVIYWGNNGLREAMWSAPGGGPDTLDTVENVFVQNPEPGFWTVQVTASEINQDTHAATPELDADYALVVSGVNVATATQAPAKIRR